MAQSSKIEWTESTWNPVTGCTKFSEGCLNCYAERMALRLRAMGNARYKKGFSLTLHHDLIETPLKWKKPRIIFVNSMGDLFHKDVPLTFIKSVFAAMNAAHWHVFQVVTKRAERLSELADKLQWTPNIWVGVTVESKRQLHRIDHLRRVPANVKFLSMEPLLSAFPRFSTEGIDWIIVGGESGPRSRPMSPDWARGIRDLCAKNRTPFFFKQWGGTNKKAAGRKLDGRHWDEMPALADSTHALLR